MTDPIAEPPKVRNPIMIVEIRHHATIIDRYHSDHDPGYQMGDHIDTPTNQYLVILRRWRLVPGQPRELVVWLRERYDDPGHLQFCRTCGDDYTELPALTAVPVPIPAVVAA